jgi:hypothetical protein
MPHFTQVFIGRNEQEFYEILAAKLEIQADGGDSAAEFVKVCSEEAFNELKARKLERDADKLRNA